MMKLSNRNKGITLLETMIVTAGIGILTVMSIPKIAPFKTQAINAVNSANIHTLQTLTEAYNLLKGSYPNAADGSGAQALLVSAELLKSPITPPADYVYIYTPDSASTWQVRRQ